MSEKLSKQFPNKKTATDDSIENDPELKKLLEQRKKVDARINAKLAKKKVQERKNETRRKIIIGGIVMYHVEEFDPELKGKIQQLLHRAVKKNADREFLGLPPMDEKKTGT